MGNGNDSILEAYLFETNSLLEQLDSLVLAAEEKDSFSEEDVNTIFRIMHTIKGSSAMMEYSSLMTIAHRGGVRDGHTLKAIQLGGSSCGYIKGSQLDQPVDFDSLRRNGKSLGSGAVLVLNETHNMVDQVQQILHFMCHESCGKCTPCREGLYQACQLIDKFAASQGTEQDLQMLQSLFELMSKDCFCALGQGALTAFVSAYENFPRI